MPIIELRNPIWFDTPKGVGCCHFIVYHGVENSLQWVCFMQDTGECWTFDNTEVRAQKNITLGRRIDERGADQSTYENGP